ncbi:MAG: hypothetical protein ACJAVX_002536 [Pseudoalteromonas rhizosphaerae]|jgi:hypothetical protein
MFVKVNARQTIDEPVFSFYLLIKSIRKNRNKIFTQIGHMHMIN